MCCVCITNNFDICNESILTKDHKNMNLTLNKFKIKTNYIMGFLKSLHDKDFSRLSLNLFF